MHANRKTAPFMAALLAAAMAAGGCSEEGGNVPGEIERSNGTVAAVLSERSELSVVAEAMTSSGLASVFDGPGAYTVLAPEDEAFEALGESGDLLTDDSQRAVLVALVRDHILPGQLDTESVRAAIERKGGPVQMTTLGDGIISFALDGDALTVSGEGTTATVIADRAVIASNGVVLPIDALLELPPAD